MRSGILLLVLALMFAAPAWAVDPSVPWRTIETPNFRVHFHEGPGMEALAQKTARICEAAHERLVPKLRWTPERKVDVMLTDDVDSANGSAFTQYRPWMKLYAEVPDDLSVLNDFEDSLWNLIVHEYTHVLHLDKVSGLPSVVNAVFGKMWIPNAAVPRWLTEGLATYEESNLSNAGRLRSALFEMWLRESVLEHPYDLAQTSHVPFGWPRGSLAYLYGGHFMSYVAEQVGEERLPDFFDTYGATIIPGTLNVTAEDVWDRTFVGMYDDWMASTRARFLEQLRPVREAGVTPFKQLTRSGYGTDQPHFTRDGERIVYLEAGPDRRPQLRSVRADGSDDRLIRELWTGGTFDLSPDDRRAVLSLGDIHEEHYVFEDLYELDLKTGELERLSTALRAAEPAYSPDGEQIAFVGRSGAGATYLGVMDRKARSVTKLLEASADARVFTPTFSPDGQSIVFSQKAGTGRRLVRLDLATKQAEVLVESDALLVQPHFAHERALLFSSDQTGIYNLYGLDLEDGHLYQLTNVTSGAFHPHASADASQIAFVTYSWNGYDVAVMRREDVFTGALPARAPRPEHPYVDDDSKTFAVRDYNAMESLLPYYWLPLYGTDAVGPVAGLTTGGGDILDRHRYTLELTYGFASKEPGLYAAYSNRTFHPGVDVYATTGIAQAAGFATGLYDRQSAAGASMSFPSSSFDQYSSLSAGYEYRYYDPHYEASLLPDGVRPTLPKRGATGTATLSFYFSNARGYGNSVSAEEGYSAAVTLRHSSPFTLGDFTFTAVDGRFQTYLRAPWSLHHAFALQLQAASALGDIGDRPIYALGGVGVFEPIVQLIRGQRVGSGVLRGYPPRAFAGNSYALGTLEYRFPIATFDQGISSLPFFFRRLHGAVFTDVGSVGQQAFQLGAVKPGAGAEVRADVVVGYNLYLTLRFGLAQGFAPEGIANLYLTLGSSF